MHPTEHQAFDGDLRRNPVSGEFTVVASVRRGRPNGVAGNVAGNAVGDAAEPQPTCPFCQGHEQLTPPEIDALRDEGGANEPGWRVRVVPNKYPAFADGHEVIVHSPAHEAEFEWLSANEATDVIRMYQRRLEALLTRGAAAVTIIHNRGGLAGASLAHPHSQVIATQMVPPVLQRELNNLSRYRDLHGTCLLCDMGNAAVAELRTPGAAGSVATAARPTGLGEEALPVFAQDGLVAWTPRAARFSYELWLAPQTHEADMRAADPRAVAVALQRALRAVGSASGAAALNYWLHTAPGDGHNICHWHIEIAPRLSAIAGFELGSGITINSVDPAEAAAQLRHAAE